MDHAGLGIDTIEVDADGIALLSEATIPLQAGGESLGSMRMQVYRDGASRSQFCTLIAGRIRRRRRVHMRLHDACFTSEVFGSCKCDCKHQLELAQRHIAHEAESGGGGLIVYTFQEGRNIGLANKIAAYDLQERQHLDTVDANVALGLPAENRSYNFVPAVLRRLGVDSVMLLTNNPFKLRSLADLGVAVEGRLAAEAQAGELPKPAQAYLRAKKDRMGHMVERALLEAPAATTTATKKNDGAKGTAAMNGAVTNSHDDSPSSSIFPPSTRLSGGDAWRLVSWTQARIAASQCSQQPFVTLTYAQSLDGSIASRPQQHPQHPRPAPQREQLVLSGGPAMALTHALRAVHDAILVGVGTVLADDPRLSVRLADGDDPLPVVLDGSLRLPVDCRLVRRARDKHEARLAAAGTSTVGGGEAGGAGGAGGGTAGTAGTATSANPLAPFLVVLTTEVGRRQPSFSTLASLPGVAVEVIESPLLPGGGGGHNPVALRSALALLKERFECRSVMVEGGAQVIASFLAASSPSSPSSSSSFSPSLPPLVDNVVITVSPVLVGGLSAVPRPIGGGGWQRETRFRRSPRPAASRSGATPSSSASSPCRPTEDSVTTAVRGRRGRSCQRSPRRPAKSLGAPRRRLEKRIARVYSPTRKPAHK